MTSCVCEGYRKLNIHFLKNAALHRGGGRIRVTFRMAHV